VSGKKLNQDFIPAVEWSSAILPILKEGHELKLLLSGRSMHPLLLGGRDEVVIKLIDNMKLKRGDIVLYCRDDGTHVLHRIHHIKNYSYYMLGDAQTWIEGPIDDTQVLAVAVYIIRKGRTISCKGKTYRLISELWLILRPVRPLILFLATHIWTFIKKFIPAKHLQ
jgi:hypothetical protein